jgi:hypothetical protein
MIFLHGTAIMHRGGLGRTREERVRQVLDGDGSLYDFMAYVPVGDAVQKIQTWREQGAEILYLSSHEKVEDVEKDKFVLRTYGFPDGPVYFRHGVEGYSDIAESVLPDILIEDDCESIGGSEEMTYPSIKPELKPRVKAVVVKEFGGIDHLPDDVLALMKC